jgi:hypothetical protein
MKPVEAIAYFGAIVLGVAVVAVALLAALYLRESGSAAAALEALGVR